MYFDKDKICWNITSNCNLNCSFCYANKNIKNGSYDIQIRILSILIEKSIKQICFTGGEPLMHGHIMSLLKHAKKSGYFVHLSTNGILLNYIIDKELYKYVDVISIPLDGATDEINYKIRKVHRYINSFNKVVKTTENFNIPIRIYTMVTPENQNDLLNIYKKIYNIKNIESWRLSNYYSVGKIKSNYHLTSKKYFESVKIIEELNSNLKIVVRYKDEMYQKKIMLMDPIGNLYTTIKHKHIVIGNIFSDHQQKII